jgi:hypothetical protein
MDAGRGKGSQETVPTLQKIFEEQIKIDEN